MGGFLRILQEEWRILRRACYRSWYMGRMMYFLLCNGMRLCQTMPGYTLLFLLLEGIQRCSLGSGAKGRAGRRMWIYSGRKCILLLQYWRIQPHMRSLPLKLRNWCLFIPLQAIFHFRLVRAKKWHLIIWFCVACQFETSLLVAELPSAQSCLSSQNQRIIDSKHL